MHLNCRAEVPVTHAPRHPSWLAHRTADPMKGSGVGGGGRRIRVGMAGRRIFRGLHVVAQ